MAHSLNRHLLFRYHRDWPLCRNRLELLRHFNPQTPIHGLFGGPPPQFAAAEQQLGDLFASHFCAAQASARCKWVHGDRLLQAWFRQEGRRHRFDGIVLTEWDLLLLAPLERIFAEVAGPALGLTGLTDLEALALRWNWTDALYDSQIHGSPRLDFWRLRRRLHRQYQRPVRRLAVNLGAAWLPRRFLEQYAALELPRLGNDEARIMAYAQALGFALANNGILRQIDAREDLCYFNANRHTIPLPLIEQAVQQRQRMVFHPCHLPYPLPS